MKIEIQELPIRRVAYARALGPYARSAEQAWPVTCRWAGPRGHLKSGAQMIGISHDDPSITPPEKLRYDACVTGGDDVQAERDIGVQTLPAGKYAVAHFEGPGEQISQAYGKIFGEFLPDQGYQPGDSQSYEVYHNEPKVDGKFVMDICVPMKPL